MSVNNQYLVALCLVLFGELVALTEYFYIHVQPEPIKLNWYSKTQCSGDSLASYPKDTQHIEIVSNTELIPVKAFQEAEHLRFIKGINRTIRILASSAFFNLPAVEKIDLSFNLIRYIHKGVFVNVSATNLDLSWNRIMYIEENSFNGLRKFDKLDLSHNEISIFSDLPSMSPIQELNLSYNFLEKLEIGSISFPNLTVLDLSFNRLGNFAITSKIRMKKIDLTMNFLTGLNKFNVVAVEELRLAMNRLTFVQDNLFEGHAKIRKISLYPNIWHCKDLRKMWKILQEHNTTMLRSDNDYRIAAQGETSPICVDLRDMPIYWQKCVELMNTLEKINLELIKDKHTPCQEDQTCSDEELCRNQQCFNPCKENVCDSTSLCKAKNHTFRCDCPKNQTRDPEDLNSRCLNVACFYDDNCPISNDCD